jgi:hypothetical protein
LFFSASAAAASASATPVIKELSWKQKKRH